MITIALILIFTNVCLFTVMLICRTNCSLRLHIDIILSLVVLLYIVNRVFGHSKLCSSTFVHFITL